MSKEVETLSRGHRQNREMREKKTQRGVSAASSAIYPRGLAMGRSGRPAYRLTPLKEERGYRRELPVYWVVVWVEGRRGKKSIERRQMVGAERVA